MIVNWNNEIDSICEFFSIGYTQGLNHGYWNENMEKIHHDPEVNDMNKLALKKGYDRGISHYFKSLCSEMSE